MPTSLKAHLRQTFVDGIDYYARDLGAMTHEQLATSPGGAARSGYDFTYELVVVHRRIEARLAGKDPGPYPGADGWIVAPAEFRDPEVALRQVKETGQSILGVWDALPESELEKEIPIPSGKTSPLDVMSLACAHINYHDAQLNYIQAIHGDKTMHWQD